MSLERTAGNIARREKQDPPLSHEDAVRLQILDEKADTIAGHEIYHKKGDPKLLVKDGFLRALNLERYTRAYLYAENVGENAVIDDTSILQPEEYFSFDDIKRGYGVVRKKHNEDFAVSEEEAMIPRLDPASAHIFLREEVAAGKVKLAQGRALEDIDLYKHEDKKMYYFPRSEYRRERGDMEKERELLKGTALRILKKSRKERVNITGDEEVGWITPEDLVDVFEGLADNSKYRTEPGMYLSHSTAESFIREQMRYEPWEERAVAITMETEDSELAVINEVTQYRQALDR